MAARIKRTPNSYPTPHWINSSTFSKISQPSVLISVSPAISNRTSITVKKYVSANAWTEPTNISASSKIPENDVLYILSIILIIIYHQKVHPRRYPSQLFLMNWDRYPPRLLSFWYRRKASSHPSSCEGYGCALDAARDGRMILIRSWLISSRAYLWHRWVRRYVQVCDCVTDFEVIALGLGEVWPFLWLSELSLKELLVEWWDILCEFGVAFLTLGELHSMMLIDHIFSIGILWYEIIYVLSCKLFIRRLFCCNFLKIVDDLRLGWEVGSDLLVTVYDDEDPLLDYVGIEGVLLVMHKGID